MIDKQVALLERPLAWFRQHTPPPDAGLMARSAAFLYGSGATLVLLCLLTAQAPGTNVIGVVTVILVAATVAVMLWVWRDSVPAEVFPALTFSGSLLITLLMFFDGARASAFSLLYVWAAVYAFYFYRPPMAVFQILVIAAMSGTELFLREGGNVPMERWLMMVGTGTIAGIVMQQLAQQVRALADRDSLTGLANRRNFESLLEREMAVAGRNGTELCVVMIDLDHFKRFNDEMGHFEGDRHLKEAGELWMGELRDGDLIARLGGEEFAVMLPSCNIRNGMMIAERLRLATPNEQTASAGVARWDRREALVALLQRADAALYEAKVAGRDRTVRASDPDPVRGERSIPQMWAKLLPNLIEERRIRFAYQPIMRLTDRELVGFEALARLNERDVELGVEGMFAAAQRLGFGRDLDWMCRRLCLERSRELVDGKLLFLNVGVAGLLSPMHDPDQMLLLMQWTGWSPRDIVLEITERDVISDLDRLRHVLAEYRSCGFTFAVDDVGDGHSTLEVLAAACPEYVKLAKRLTATCDQPGPRAAIRAVVAFAHTLESLVVAEGIETTSQLAAMMQLGCGLGQGYGLGRPAFRVAPGAQVPEEAEQEIPVLRVVG
jgi:diguanylate cyclase (GGDEF)-like protein